MPRPRTSSAPIGGLPASTIRTSARRRTPRRGSRRSAKPMRCCATPRSAPRTTRSARAGPARSFARRPIGNSTTGAGGDPGVHSDFFEQLFGGLGRGRGSFRSRGFDTAGQVEVSLEEAFRGTERRLSLQRIAARRARPRAADDAAIERADPGRRRRRPADPRRFAGSARRRRRSGRRPVPRGALVAAPLVPRRGAGHLARPARDAVGSRARRDRARADARRPRRPQVAEGLADGSATAPPGPRLAGQSRRAISSSC